MASDYSASINWGNGQTSSGTIGGSNGLLTVSGSTTYATSGLDRITVNVVDTSGLTTVAHSVANVSDAAVTISALSLSADQGTAFSGVVGSFTSANPLAPASTFTAVITWGDGNITAGAVAPNGVGGFNVTGTNTYLNSGTFTYSIRITSRGGTVATGSGTIGADDQDHWQAAPGVGAINAVEGEWFVGNVASFKDSAPTSAKGYSAVIFWGDGQRSAGTIVPAGRRFLCYGQPHSTSRNEGTYSRVDRHCRGPGCVSLTMFVTAIVADAPLTADTNLPASALEMSSAVSAVFSGEVAQFTDADPRDNDSGDVGQYTSTVYWGDGTSSAGSISTPVRNGLGGDFLVTGSHTYSAVGVFSLATLITDIGGATVTAYRTMTVTGPPLTLSPISFSPTEGIAFQGAIATIAGGDPNASATDYAATIDWGDGITSSRADQRANGRWVQRFGRAHVLGIRTLHGPDPGCGTRRRRPLDFGRHSSGGCVALRERVVDQRRRGPGVQRRGGHRHRRQSLRIRRGSFGDDHVG